MLAVGVIFIGIQASAQSAKFISRWQIIKGQSDFGGLEEKIAAPNTIKLAMNADSLFVYREFAQMPVLEERLKIGAPDVETLVDQKTLKLSGVNWDKKANQFIFRATYEINGAQWVYWRTETWKVKGELLEVQRTTIMPDKVDRVKAVYQKVK